MVDLPHLLSSLISALLFLFVARFFFINRKLLKGWDPAKRLPASAYLSFTFLNLTKPVKRFKKLDRYADPACRIAYWQNGETRLILVGEAKVAKKIYDDIGKTFLFTFC